MNRPQATFNNPNKPVKNEYLEHPESKGTKEPKPLTFLGVERLSITQDGLHPSSAGVLHLLNTRSNKNAIFAFDNLQKSVDDMQ